VLSLCNGIIQNCVGDKDKVLMRGSFCVLDIDIDTIDIC